MSGFGVEAELAALEDLEVGGSAAERPAPKACEQSVARPMLTPKPRESPVMLEYILPSDAASKCAGVSSQWLGGPPHMLA